MKENEVKINKLWNKVAIVVSAPPAFSLLLIYTLATWVWCKFRVWPFQDSNPPYQEFTGFLKIHDMLATMSFLFLTPFSFLFIIYIIWDSWLNKKKSIIRVTYVGCIYCVWWLAVSLDPGNIIYWLTD